MKKFIKFLMSLVVTLVFLVSLSVGVLRPIEKVEEEKISYYLYSAEGVEYSWKKLGESFYLVIDEDEIECTLEEGEIRALMGDAEISAILAEDGLLIKVPVDPVEPAGEPEPVAPVEPEVPSEEGQDPTEPEESVEPSYLYFTRSTEPVEVIVQPSVRYSDYVMTFLGLDGLEELLGKHYFNSIFSSLAGSSLVTLICLFTRKSKTSKTAKNKKSDKKGKSKGKKSSGDKSIIRKIPDLIEPNRQPRIKF